MRVVCALGLVWSAVMWGHCQIPCGIYHDDLVFAQMNEQVETIAKSTQAIIELEKVCHNPQVMNQTTRWIINRDHQADHLAEMVSTYFLQQRIPVGSGSAKILATAHQLLVSAMKVKQNVGSQPVQDLQEVLKQFATQYQELRGHLDGKTEKTS